MFALYICGVLRYLRILIYNERHPERDALLDLCSSNSAWCDSHCWSEGDCVNTHGHTNEIAFQYVELWPSDGVSFKAGRVRKL